MKKRDPFFDRLRAASKEVGYHVLTACGVPLLNYITRTHDPNVVHDAAERFDEQVIGAFSYLAGTTLPDTAIEIMQLPRKRGGAGVALYVPALADNYAASKGAADRASGRTAQAATAQHILAMKRHDAVVVSLENDPVVKRQLHCQKEVKWLTLDCRYTHQLAACDEFAAALRRHVRAPLESYAALATCRYCRAGPYTPYELQEHTTTCTKKTGINVGSTHAGVKLSLNGIFITSGIQVTGCEEVYRTVRCGCGSEFTPVAFHHHQHAAQCTKADESQCHIVQADGKAKLGGRWHVWDNTSPNPMCPSYVRSSVAQLANSVRSAKTRRYGDKAAADGADFAVVFIPLHGWVDDLTRTLLKKYSEHTGIPATVIIGELQRAAEIGASQAQIRTERAMGLNHTSRVGRRAPRPLTAHETIVATAPPPAAPGATDTREYEPHGAVASGVDPCHRRRRRLGRCIVRPKPVPIHRPGASRCRGQRAAATDVPAVPPRAPQLAALAHRGHRDSQRTPGSRSSSRRRGRCRSSTVPRRACHGNAVLADVAGAARSADGLPVVRQHGHCRLRPARRLHGRYVRIGAGACNRG